MPQGYHRRLPSHVEDEVWDVFALPLGEQSARVTDLCRQHAGREPMIRRLVLMIEQSGVAASAVRGGMGAAGGGDPSSRRGRRAEECRLVAEFLWRVLERVSVDVAAVGHSDAVRHAAKLVLEVDLRDRPAAATVLRERLAGSQWLSA